MSRRSHPIALLGLMVAALMLIVVPAASAKSRDRNHDRIPDKWETKHHLSLKVKQAGKDQDRDHMNNMAEFKAGTDPRDADTDDDGVKDGNEDAGTIVSFKPATATAPGSLTIKLLRDNTMVTGAVDEKTEIKCEDHAATPAPASIRAHDDGEGDGQGEDAKGAPATGTPTPPAGHDDEGDDDDQGDDENEGEDDAMCGTGQLTPGAVVHEAELSTMGGALRFDEIKLGAAPTASTPAPRA